MADIERLDRALTWIEAHPEQHDQGVWVRNTPEGKVDCGTAACLAGWVVAQAHPDAVFVPDKLDLSPRLRHTRMRSAVRIDDQEEEPISDRARRLLDISDSQADALFSASNDLDDLKRMRDMLAEDPEISGTDLADNQDDWWGDE